MVKRVLGNAITRCSGEREVRAGLSGVVATRGTPHFPSTSRFICILPHFKPFFKVHQLNMNLFASTSTLHHQPSKPNETKPNPPPDTSRRGALPLRQPLPCATWEAPQALPTQQPLGSSETRRAQVRPRCRPPPSGSRPPCPGESLPPEASRWVTCPPDPGTGVLRPGGGKAPAALHRLAGDPTLICAQDSARGARAPRAAFSIGSPALGMSLGTLHARCPLRANIRHLGTGLTCSFPPAKACLAFLCFCSYTGSQHTLNSDKATDVPHSY